MQLQNQLPIDTATRVILTEDGSSYFFSRRQRLQRFRLINGQDEYGLQLQEYRPETLYKMIAGGLVRKLQYPVADALQQRDGVIRYISTLALGVLSRHVANQLWRTTRKSTLMVRWARAHPKSALGTPETTLLITRYLDAKKDVLAAQRHRFTSRVRADFRRAVERPVDQSEFQPLIDRLIEQVPPEAWFLIVSTESDTSDLFEQLASEIVRVAVRAELVDYLAIVWVELLVHLQHRPDREESVDSPATHLLTQLSTRDDGAHDVIHIMASRDGARFAALRADLEDVMKSSHHGVQTFDQFWRSASGGNGDLGMYYIGFLEEACARLGVGLQTFAQENDGDGRLNMVMTL